MAMKREDVLLCREAIRQGNTVSITRFDSNLNKNLTETIHPQIKNGYINDPDIVHPIVKYNDTDVWNLSTHNEWFRRNTNSMSETISRNIAFRNPGIKDDLIMQTITNENDIIDWKIIDTNTIKEYQQSWRKKNKIESILLNKKKNIKKIKVNNNESFKNTKKDNPNVLVCVSKDPTSEIIRIPKLKALILVQEYNHVFRTKQEWKEQNKLSEKETKEFKPSNRNYNRIIMGRRKPKYIPFTNQIVTQKYKIEKGTMDISPLGESYIDINNNPYSISTTTLVKLPKQDKIIKSKHIPIKYKDKPKKEYIIDNNIITKRLILRNPIAKNPIINKDNTKLQVNKENVQNTVKTTENSYLKELNKGNILLPLKLANGTEDCERIPKWLLKKSKSEITKWIKSHPRLQMFVEDIDSMVTYIYYFNRKGKPWKVKFKKKKIKNIQEPQLVDKKNIKIKPNIKKK